MELKDRLRIILDEQNIKQKDLADTIKVTESYISNMLSGKRNNISKSLALLLEQRYGYSSHWILTGEGEPYNAHSNPKLSSTKKRLIAEIEKMSDSEINAVKIFIDSLDEYKKAFSLENKEENIDTIQFPLQRELETVGRDGKIQTTILTEQQAIENQKFLEENFPEIAKPSTLKKF